MGCGGRDTKKVVPIGISRVQLAELVTDHSRKEGEMVADALSPTRLLRGLNSVLTRWSG